MQNAELISRLMRSDIGQKLQADYAAENLEARRKLVKEIAKVRAEAAKEILPLKAADEKAKKAASDAYEAYKKANEAATVAEAWLLSAKSRRDVRVNALERELRDTIPDFVREAYDKICALEQETMRHSVNSYRRDDRKADSSTGRTFVEYYSDYPSLEERLIAIRLAKKEIFEEWPLAAMSDGELRNRFKAMLEALPKIEIRLAGKSL
jgi:hypothetical protein